jgi:DNA polymerase III delta prime subunit
MKGSLLTQEEIDELLRAMEMPDCEENFILDIEEKSQLILDAIQEYKKRKGEEEEDLTIPRKLIFFRFLRLRKTPFHEETKIIIGS